MFALRTVFASSALALIMPLQAFAITPLNLQDVGASDPDRTALEFLNQHDVLYGYIDGTIHPDKPVTRAELLKIVLEANGKGADAIRASVTTAPFSDVPTSHTLVSYIAYAKASGFVSGYPDGTYHPNSSVSRAEAMKIILNAFYDGCNLQFASAPYNDTARSTLKKYIDQAYSLNLYRPAGGSFLPNTAALRREAAQSIYRTIIAASQPESGCLVNYTTSLSVPATTKADWTVRRDTPVFISVPPQWKAGYKMSTGVTDIDPIFTPWETTESSAALMGVHARMYETPITAPAGSIEVTMNHISIDNPASEGTGMPQYVRVDVLEYVIASNGSRGMEWKVGNARYSASYDERRMPGLRGVFYRFVQNAVSMNQTF